MPKGVEQDDVTFPAHPINAPGQPGRTPRWSSGAKDAIGTATSFRSRVWFTIGSGTLNEIYFPDADATNTRSVRFLITGPDGFFSDEQYDTNHRTEPVEDGIPAYRIHTCCKQGRYTIHKEIVTDIGRDTLVLRVRFEAYAPSLRLFLYAEPQIQDKGYGNSAHVGDYKGSPMLMAGRLGTALAIASSAPYLFTTCGYTGVSDGYADLKRHGHLTRCYNSAPDGNIALCAELDWRSSLDLRLSLGFGGNCAEAAQQAVAGLMQDFDLLTEQYTRDWHTHQQQHCHSLADLSGNPRDLYRISASVLRIHQSKRYPGAFVASLSIPWGFARSDADVSGYHVLWPRDLVEIAMGMLACGDAQSAESALFYLACTQEADGHWAQNQWLDGTTDFHAVQMDSTALPILLACRLARERALTHFDPWPTVRRAVSYLLHNGPWSEEERWEEVPGYSVFTMATEVAALIAAAALAESAGEPDAANLLRETASAWNELIDQYTYASGTRLGRKYGVDGYYIRIAPTSIRQNPRLGMLDIQLRNKGFPNRSHLAANVVSPDALALVRMGLRSPRDPRIQQTVRVIDGELRYSLTTGPGWRRSSFDGYGEKRNGAPFDGTGMGRCWPLLAGERGHLELASGNREAALRLLRTMAAQTSECGMLPEQVWDAPDLPQRELYNGRPTGSGMPLAWAHAEYIKLLRSIHENAIWDLPQEAAEFFRQPRPCPFVIWTANECRTWIPTGKQLRLMLTHGGRALLRTRNAPDQQTTLAPAAFDFHIATMPTHEIPPGERFAIEIAPDAPGVKPYRLNFEVR